MGCGPRSNGFATPPPHPLPCSRHAVPLVRPTKSPRKQAPSSKKRTQGSASPARAPDFSQSASLDRPADVWTARSPLTSAQRNLSQGTTTTQNMTDYESLKRTFHQTVNRCHQNGIRLTPGFSAGHAGWGRTLHATWSPGSLNASAPPLTAHPAISTLNWFSASLRHCTVTPRGR